MYHSISEFLLEWEAEKEFTQKILDNISDESLNFKNSRTGRSIERLAWHIITAISKMGIASGLVFESINSDAPLPGKAKTLSEEYKRASVNLQSAISSQWTEESLSEEVNMFGQMWKKSFVLEVLVKHQIHHRGQLTMLMRQSGLRVPGIYGPAYEEWQAMGIVPQE